LRPYTAVTVAVAAAPSQPAMHREPIQNSFHRVDEESPKSSSILFPSTLHFFFKSSGSLSKILFKLKKCAMRLTVLNVAAKPQRRFLK
jgi:hypothetical protein